MEHETTRTEIHDPATPPVTPATSHTTTVIREKRGSGGMVLGVIAVIGILVAAFVFMNQQDSEVMRDAAIADAAQKVGDSAQQAGEAVENAADKLTTE